LRSERIPVTSRPDESRGRIEQAPKSRRRRRPTLLRTSAANAVPSPTAQRRPATGTVAWRVLTVR
jgi:hypothetical protein